MTGRFDQPLRFALIGAGGIAQSYVEVFRGCTSARVVAVADPRLEVARAAAAGLGSEAFASAEELLDRVECDAALVCTPPVTHVDICLDLLSRGIPVLCEKPLTLDLSSARKLLERSEETGVLLTMAAKFRYVDDMIRAKSIVDSGILGEIVLFENVFASRVTMAGRWNADPEISGGGVLIDNGTHSVDVARYFLGPISEVTAVEGKRVQQLPVEDTARLFVLSSDRVHGTIDLSWSLDKEVDSYIEIYGSNGTITVGWRESRYRQASSPDWVRFGSGYDKIDAMRRQVANFCGAVHGREQLLITAEDALASVAVIEAAYASMAEDHWFRVGAGAP
jgi:predicted dehydrogenase